MAPNEFAALLAHHPMRRTGKGTRVASSGAFDFPAEQLALLRRFTGETTLDYLLPAGVPVESAVAVAFDLYRQGLIVPNDEPRPTSW